MLINVNKQKEIYKNIINDINSRISSIDIDTITKDIAFISIKIDLLKTFECFKNADLKNIRLKTKEQLLNVYKSAAEDLQDDITHKNDTAIYFYF